MVISGWNHIHGSLKLILEDQFSHGREPEPVSICCLRACLQVESFTGECVGWLSKGGLADFYERTQKTLETFSSRGVHRFGDLENTFKVILISRRSGWELAFECGGLNRFPIPLSVNLASVPITRQSVEALLEFLRVPLEAEERIL